MGANIGTCVTALLAAIGKPREAVRCAVVHTGLAVTGVLIWLPFVSFIANFVTAISPTYPDLTGIELLAAETPRQIANAHTFFNIANRCIFLWFSTYFAPIAVWLVPDKPLEVRAKCRFKDVAGGRGAMELQVSQAEVKRFFAEVSIPRQGTCRFDLKQFRQTGKLPTVVLADTESECTVRMWEQELGKTKGVTVAFNNCQAKCEGDAFSYLWPILVDPRNGRCA